MFDRQACAIESAAKWNEDRDIFVMFTSNVGIGLKSPIFWALDDYPNIHFRNLNLDTYAIDTPMENWWHTNQLFHSKYLVSHTSDFLRYTSMYRFGGIYLDLDVVVQQSFNLIPPNFAAAESEHFVAVGAIGFEANGIGHEIAELCARYLDNQNYSTIISNEMISRQQQQPNSTTLEYFVVFKLKKKFK